MHEKVIAYAGDRRFRNNLRHWVSSNSKDIPVLLKDKGRQNVIFLSGKGIFWLNFKPIEYDGSYILFLCPGEVFYIENCDKLLLIYSNKHMEFKYGNAYRYTFGTLHKIFKLDCPYFKRLIWFSENNEKETSRKANSIQKYPRNLINRLMNEHINDLYANIPTYPDLIHDYVLLVQNNYMSFHNIDYYSEILRTIPKRMTERFKSAGAPSPHIIIKNRLMVEAKRQLLFTNKPIKDICYDLGFNDPAYFSRLFKKHENMTPKSFRENGHVYMTSKLVNNNY